MKQVTIKDLPLWSRQTWTNWSENIKHLPPEDAGAMNYAVPKTQADLLEVLSSLSQSQATGVRVTGQRHSHPPLVANNNSSNPPKKAESYQIDMACYADLG